MSGFVRPCRSLSWGSIRAERTGGSLGSQARADILVRPPAGAEPLVGAGETVRRSLLNSSEDEFFGHVRGAFTRARRFQHADGATLATRSLCGIGFSAQVWDRNSNRR